MEYDALHQLKDQFESYPITISFQQQIRADLIYVNFQLNQFSCKILISDEYHDFTNENRLVDFFLVLFALEIYEESEDILEWAKEMEVNADKYLSYYRGLNEVVNHLKSVFGKIDACVTAFDYQLRTGVMKELMKL
ncbi:hypothetical protein [Flammeovirga sp. SJP92]|uniref:hypothetical protein n=1 Tax=Flammeovirga sp. SJP92 TaxID=1775430 RepID=UPI000786D667|nr:hypothetical protein [Flammeovirga sp. SJP92]KXX68735.1 hypothetical protein AVL50_18865 [Flammeovirga sp. SJP92]